jgi:hypothetical protein
MLHRRLVSILAALVLAALVAADARAASAVPEGTRAVGWEMVQAFSAALRQAWAPLQGAWHAAKGTMGPGDERTVGARASLPGPGVDASDQVGLANGLGDGCHGNSAPRARRRAPTCFTKAGPEPSPDGQPASQGGSPAGPGATGGPGD